MTVFRPAELHSKILLNTFWDLSSDFEVPWNSEPQQVNTRTAKKNSDLLNFLFKLAEHCQTGTCDHKTFATDAMQKFIPLQILWYMDNLNLLSLKEYLSFHTSCKNTENVELFCKMLLDYFTGGKRKTEIGCKLCNSFLNIIFSAKTDTLVMDEPGLAVVGDKFISLITSRLLQNKNLSDCDESNFSLLKLIQELPLSKLAKKVFNLNILKSLIHGISGTFEDVLNLQQKKDYSNLNKNILEFFCRCFENFSADEILKMIKDSLLTQHSKLNWDVMLYLITVYGINYDAGFNNLKILVNQLIEESFSTLDIDKLSLAFIIARQSCLHKNNVFQSYLNWFGSSFSSESSRPISSLKICQFFLDFLVGMVRYDKSYYQKVHINKAPSVPLECQSLLSNYIKLAKTRLDDRNESTDLGFYDNPTAKSTPKNDVDQVLKSFQETQEIPRCILESTMFCKNYYEKKFLPALLSQNDGAHSVRHKVISKLHLLGKIPNSIFLQYKHPV